MRDLQKPEHLRRLGQHLARQLVPAVAQAQNRLGVDQLARLTDGASIGIDASTDGLPSAEVCGKGSETPLMASIQAEMIAMLKSRSRVQRPSIVDGIGAPSSVSA